MIYLFLWIGLTGVIVVINRGNWKSMAVLTLPTIAFIFVLWMRAVTFVVPGIQSFFMLPLMAILHWLITWGLNKTKMVQSWWRTQVYSIVIITCLVAFSILYGPIVASRPRFVSLLGLVVFTGLAYAFRHIVRKVSNGPQDRRIRNALVLAVVTVFAIFWYPWRSEDKYEYPAWCYAHYLAPRPLLTRWYGGLSLRQTPRILLTIFHKWSVELHYPWWTPDSKLSPRFEKVVLGRLERFGERKFDTTWGDDALWVAIAQDSKKPTPPRALWPMLWRYGIGKVKEENEVQIESWTLATFGYAPSRSPGLSVPELLYWYALCCKNRGEEEKAVFFCEKALEEAKTPWWVSPHLTIANIHYEKGNTEVAITLLDGLLRRIPLPTYEGDIDELKSMAHALSYLYEEQGDDSTARLFYAYYRHNRRGDVIESGYETKPASEAKRQTFLLLREYLQDPQVFLWEVQDPKYGLAPSAVVTAYDLYYYPPEVVEFTRPVYPHVPEGTTSPAVVLKILVDTRGKVQEAVVLKSISKACDQAAMEAVRTATFSPAQDGGKPVEAWVNFIVRFRHPRMKNRMSLPRPTSSAVLEFAPYDTPPEIIKWIEPVYPETVRALAWPPVVMLKVLVNEKGEVEQAVVLDSWSEASDSTAVRAIRAARFSPAKMKGEPVRAWVSFPVKFRFPGLED